MTQKQQKKLLLKSIISNQRYRKSNIRLVLMAHSVFLDPFLLIAH